MYSSRPSILFCYPSIGLLTVQYTPNKYWHSIDGRHYIINIFGVRTIGLMRGEIILTRIKIISQNVKKMLNMSI